MTHRIAPCLAGGLVILALTACSGNDEIVFVPQQPQAPQEPEEPAEAMTLATAPDGYRAPVAWRGPRDT